MWIGSNVYIEILYDGGAEVAVDEIRFADRPRPARAPNPIIVDMLDDESLTNADQLAAKYADTFAEACKSECDAASMDLFNAILDIEPLRTPIANQRLPRQRLAIERETRRSRRVMALTYGTPENER